MTVNLYTSSVQERHCDVLSKTDVPPGCVYSDTLTVGQRVSCAIFPTFLMCYCFQRHVSLVLCITQEFQSTSVAAGTIRLSIPGPIDTNWDASVHKLSGLYTN